MLFTQDSKRIRSSNISSKSIRNSNKAQVSMEYLMVFSIAIMMTMPLIIIYSTQTANMQADITEYSRDKLNLNLGKNVFIGFKAVSIPVIKL